MLTFSRQERLKSRKMIAQLFKEGKSFVAYPLRVIWTVPPDEEEVGVSIAISVPKKIFKTAVARNRVKRQIREAYRLNKQDLFEKLAGHSVALMLIYVAKEALPYAEIEAGIRKMIKKWPDE